MRNTKESCNEQIEKLSELLTKAQQNPELIYSLWEELAPMWKSWSRKMSVVDYSREDWEQQSFLLIQKAIETYDAKYQITFTGYYRMILNRWGKQEMQKKRSCLIQSEEIEETLMNQKDETVDVELDCQDKAIYRELMAYFTYLKEDEQRILKAFYIEQKPVGTIAKEMNTTYKSVEGKKIRALKKLKNILLENNF